MTCTALVRLLDTMLWDLRRAWATGRRISVSLTDHAGRRVEGHVDAVSATGVSVTINGTVILAEDILGVHHPAQWMSEDSTWRGVSDFHGQPRRVEPQREQLPRPGGWDL